MGRQIQFHLLEQDCSDLLRFIQERDPVFLVDRDSDSAEVEAVADPCHAKKTLCLWNQALLDSIERRYIPKSNVGPYYRVSSELPVLEFWMSRKTEWKGKPALTQGRIWGDFRYPNTEHDRWYNAIVGWIRRRYVRVPIPNMNGYIGPSAMDWYGQGGILLPLFLPPVTPAWEKFMADQDERRAGGRRPDQ